METKDEQFFKILLETFKIEAEDRLKNLSNGLIELEKKLPTEKQDELIESTFREIHSLKGAARSVNFEDIEKLCQTTESVFSLLKKKEITINPELIEILFSVVDCIKELLLFDFPDKVKNAKSKSLELIEILKLAQSGKVTPSLSKQEPKIEIVENTITEKYYNSDSTVRIPLKVLDSIMNQIEELRSVKLMAQQQTLELDEIEKEFSLFQKETEKSKSNIRKMRQWLKNYKVGNGDGNNALNPMVTKLLESTEKSNLFLKLVDSKVNSVLNSSGHYSRTVDSLVDSLLDEMKKLLMLPFSKVLEGFPKLVRDLSHDQDKKVELEIVGKEIEIDKRILDEIKDPLIHILRNCIDHGIENAEIRKTKGKTSISKMKIAISQTSSKLVEIKISDNGAGIDLETLRRVLQKNNILPEDKLAQLSEIELLPFVFQSGISTKPIITDISGRGLGLAIVKEKVEKLGGNITLESVKDVGTTFIINLPLTLASFRGVLVKENEQQFIIPSSYVERVLFIEKENIKTAENREIIEIEGQVISLVHLGDVLEIRRKKQLQNESRKVHVFILQSSKNRIAFLVDEIFGEQEVIVKTLGKQLLNVRNIIGATILGNGNVVPILDALDLLNSAVIVQKIGTEYHENEIESENKKRVLVAEDSITSRSLLKGILESAGYNVKTAVDGLDAYTQLSFEEFDILVSDVDMPKMSGFTLTEKIRSDKKLSKLPVVLVTALESQSDKERGIDVGANAYIVKRSFDQSNLLEIVNRLI